MTKENTVVFQFGRVWELEINGVFDYFRIAIPGSH